MEQQHLAIASVPMQNWETLYDWDQALATGTIFPGLNKPFFVLEENSFETEFKPDENASPEQQERERLMKEISALSFALDDTVLYLDTHPMDSIAKSDFPAGRIQEEGTDAEIREGIRTSDSGLLM